MNLNNLTVDTKRHLIDYAFNKLNVEESIKEAYFELYDMVYHKYNTATFEKIPFYHNICKLLTEPLTQFYVLNNDYNVYDLKFENKNIADFIDFRHITMSIELLPEEEERIFSLKLIDKILKKEIKIVI